MKKEKIIPYVKAIITILLFIFISLVEYIPIKLLNLDINNLSPVETVLLSIFAYVIQILIIFFMYRKELKRDFKNFKNNFWEHADTAIKYWMIGLLVMMVSNLLIQILTPSKMANNEQSVDNIIKSVPFLAMILTTCLAPFTEEMTFRKAFSDIFKGHKIAFILVSGILFGSLHVVGSVTALYDYFYIIPYSALGIAFAAMDAKHNNIFPSIMIHMIHNGLLTILQILISGNIL